MAGKPLPQHVQRCLSALTALGAVDARAMFGGYGLYCDGVMFALVAAQRLWLKVDSQTRPDFEAAGLPAFQPFADKPMRMSYHGVPAAWLEDPETLLPWAEQALAAARRARRKTKRR